MRFQNEQAKVVDTLEESIRTLLTIDICPQADLWKKFQKKDHISLGQFYKMASKHIRVESSLEALSKSTSSNKAQLRQERNPDRKRYPDRNQSWFQKKREYIFGENESLFLVLSNIHL